MVAVQVGGGGHVSSGEVNEDGAVVQGVGIQGCSIHTVVGMVHEGHRAGEVVLLIDQLRGIEGTEG